MQIDPRHADSPWPALMAWLASLGGLMGLRGRLFGSASGRMERRHPDRDERDEIRTRRRDDGVGGES